MSTAPSEAASWADVLLEEGPEPSIAYRTSWVSYEESLTRGRFVGRGWNGAGYVNSFAKGLYDARVEPNLNLPTEAFWLETDGQALCSEWEWGGMERLADHQPVPAMPRPFSVHAIVTLRHRVRPVTVRVHTGLDGTPILTRWLEITNTGDRPMALAQAFPWSGVQQKTMRQDASLAHASPGLYTVGFFANTSEVREGDFRWLDLPPTGLCIDGRSRHDRWRHPWFVLRNNASGEHFVGQLAWSGGYRFEFDLAIDATHFSGNDATACLFFRGGPEAPAPQRVVDPGETVATPEMHLGLVFGDLDAAVQAMHDHVRRSVVMPQPRGRGGWVESGIGPEVEITPELVERAIDHAADFGAEVFFIDASWYSPPGANWFRSCGDWHVDPRRFPEGLAPLRERVHRAGMLWGLWMDPERAGEESATRREHPEWLATAYDGEHRLFDMLDLGSTDVAARVESQIVRVIEENELDFFRLDFNVTHLAAGARSPRGGYLENHYWRYYENLAAIWDRLRARFPGVVFENCSSGGGRTDLGFIRRFSHTWVSDWQIAPRSFSIVNGMTMALPPELVDRLLGGMSGHMAGDFDFQSRLLLFCRPTIGFSGAPSWNPHQLQRLRRWVALYKDFVRPMMSASRIYHHTPVAAGPEPAGWGVLEMASEDRSRGLCGLFRLGSPAAPEYLLRLRGLDESRRYRVTFDTTGRTCAVDGFTLMKQGLTVRLEGALTSELLLMEATENAPPTAGSIPG